jgi:energy-coupling factor transporter ATP-binding protein EcfA2
VPKPWDITGDDLVRWSQQYDAPSVLPDLVRRLLLATTPISLITMNAHAGTRLRDWDGVVRSSTETAFCPVGMSVWELTVEGELGKFSSDFKKRSQEKGTFEPGQTHYVAVSARRVSGKVRWAADRRAEKSWKDVRLLDADDLAAWVATAPAVARWFAAKIGHPAADGEDLEGYLGAWSRRTRVRLPVEIALAGQDRQRLAEGVRAWARSARRDEAPLRIYALAWEEAAVFAAAALGTDPSPEGEQVRARTVVALSEETLRSALRAEHAEPLVVIAAFPRASTELGPVVLPMEGAVPADGFDVVRIGPVPHLRFSEILVRSGMSEREAQRAASGSGGSLGALQRLLGYVELPRWAEGIARVPLSVMLLAGAFEPGNTEDREVLSLLGAEAPEVELLCEHLRLAPEAPMHKEEGRAYRPVWTWRAPDDAWRVLVGQIPAETLRRFAEVLPLVLGERDPGLDLKPEERFAAALRGKSLRASGPLRDGLVRSLVRLSLSDDALTPLHGQKRGSSLATLAVRALLPPSWEPWASLSPLLPLLAEAAPEVFLDCVEASLREGDAGVAHLLAEEAFMGGSPHTGLLWALETLGWDERWMPRVAAALARLAQEDEKLPARAGKIANRPSRSLTGLLRLIWPQTSASAEQRIQEVVRRLEETPDIGYSLLIDQIAGMGDMVVLDPSQEPQLRTLPVMTREAQNERYRKEIAAVTEAYVDLTFKHAEHDAEKWALLLRRIRPDPSLSARILDRLDFIRSLVVDEEAKLWGAVRHVLSHTTLRDEDADAEPSAQAAPHNSVVYTRWEQLYESLRPQDLALRYAWLFLPHPDLPRPFDPERDFDEDTRELARLRAEAIEAIGWSLPTLTALAERVATSSALGWTLGASSLTEKLDTYLLDSSPPPCFAPQVPAYFCARRSSKDDQWALRKLQSMLTQARLSEVEKCLSWLVSSPSTWALADALGEEVSRSYWRQLAHVPPDLSQDERDRALHRLLVVGNITTALHTARRAKENIRHEMVAEVLQALLVAARDAKKPIVDGASSHALEQLMNRLETSPDADTKYAGLLGNIELFHSLSTYDPKRPMRRLSAAFAADTSHFVTLVKQMYRRAGEPESASSPEEQQDTRRQAEGAYRILGAWKGYPGEGPSRDPHDEILYDWSLKVLRELVAEGRPDTGASEVARVLARAPKGEDGHWPCVAARRLLELNEFLSLSRSLQIAKWNLRGAHSRSLGAGGKQERDLAVEYRDSGRKLRPAYPRSADMLDALADTYEREAVQEDAEAEATMRQHGAEPQDFGETPAPPSRSPKRRVVRPGIVQIETIELTDFARIDRLAISLSPPAERGQWLVLLGENGRGKSTLLRAILLAIAGANVAQGALSKYPAPFIRLGQPSARCEMNCGGDRFSVTITNDGTGEIAVTTPANGARPPVFAYGCRRGSALSGSDAVELDKPYSDIATLFDESAQLFPARTWLKDLKLRALQNPKHEHVFRTVLQKLCDTEQQRGLLPDVERLDVIDNQVWAIAPKLGGRVPLAALSDGYLTTMGWIVDLVARWLRWAELVEGKPPEGDFFARMVGLVFVDEIDLHLHPRWQRDIIRRLKDVFPRLSFVVTTHNPITLLGADAGEIVVLREAADGSGRIDAGHFDLPPGIRADRVLTGEWFGLEYTVDDDTIALIEKHQKMLLDHVSEDAPERLALEDQLAGGYESYADTSIDRMALEVAAELMRERRPKTPKERKELRDKLEERVRERLAEKRRQGGSAR